MNCFQHQFLEPRGCAKSFLVDVAPVSVLGRLSRCHKRCQTAGCACHHYIQPRDSTAVCSLGLGNEASLVSLRYLDKARSLSGTVGEN